MCYRYITFWNYFFQTGSLFFLYLVYREWKRLGGMAGYIPPSAKPPDSLIKILE